MKRFKTASEFIDYVTVRFASKRTNQRNFKACVKSLGNPQLKLKCIHVAGTNGKGSTVNYLRSILQEAGYQVGTFTSPHLVVHNDRIRINDQNISDVELVYYANQLVDVWEEYDLSMFEIDMLISIFYFIDQKVDYVIYEVGLGGRLDATNVILPLLSLITNIGYDHMKFLGDTYEKIAYEKAGIVKDQVPLLTTEQKEECLQVFEEVCQKHHSPFIKVTIPTASFKENHYDYFYQDNKITLNTFASYQIANSVLALSAISYLNEYKLANVGKGEMIRGISQTNWKGRFEIISRNPRIIIDGAHNEEGIEALIDSMQHLKKPIVVLFSALKDKEYEKMLNKLEGAVDELVVTSFDFYRSASLSDLNAAGKRQGFSDYQDAINYVKKVVGNGTIVITGSLYFISVVRQYLLGD